MRKLSNESGNIHCQKLVTKRKIISSIFYFQLPLIYSFWGEMSSFPYVENVFSLSLPILPYLFCASCYTTKDRCFLPADIHRMNLFYGFSAAATQTGQRDHCHQNICLNPGDKPLPLQTRTPLLYGHPGVASRALPNPTTFGS